MPPKEVYPWHWRYNAVAEHVPRPRVQVPVSKYDKRIKKSKLENITHPSF